MQIASFYHLYADNLQVYCQGSADQFNNDVNTINADLDPINDWSRPYGLKVNISQVIVYGMSHFNNTVVTCLTSYVRRYEHAVL